MKTICSHRSFRRFAPVLAAATVLIVLLAAGQAWAAAQVDQMPGEPRFIEEVRPCVIPAGSPLTAPAGVQWLPLGCLTVSTAKNTTPVLIPGTEGFAVRGPETFIIHSLHPLFAVGIQCTVPANATGKLTVILQQRSGGNSAEVHRAEFVPENANGGFFNAWSDTAFNEVAIVADPAEDWPVVWTKIMTGCHPRLKQTATYNLQMRAAFMMETGATSAGNWPQTGVEAEPVVRLGPLSFLAIGATGEDPRFVVGDTFINGDTAKARASAALKLLPHGYMSLTGTESFNICPGCPVHAFGFEIMEPDGKSNSWAVGENPDKKIAYAKSKFTITLYHGETRLESFEFDPAVNELDFWGIHSPKAFTRVEIRETTGGAENELFGRFFTSDPCCCACGEKPATK